MMLEFGSDVLVRLWKNWQRRPRSITKKKYRALRFQYESGLMQCTSELKWRHCIPREELAAQDTGFKSINRGYISLLSEIQKVENTSVAASFINTGL